MTVALAARQDVPVYATGLGTVQAYVTVAIHSQVDGKLQEVLFTEGQRVKKGDVLAKIDPRLFQAAFDQAKAKKAQDEAQLIAAEKDLVRSKTLAQKDYGSQQQVDLNQAKVDQLKASIAADVAAIETAQTQLDYTSITAPSDGRVGIRLVDPGNIVHAAACAARRRKLSLFRSWRMTAIPALIDRSAIEGQSASLHIAELTPTLATSDSNFDARKEYRSLARSIMREVSLRPRSSDQLSIENYSLGISTFVSDNPGVIAISPSERAKS